MTMDFGPYFTDTAHQLSGAGVGERTAQALDTYVYDDSTQETIGTSI